MIQCRVCKQNAMKEVLNLGDQPLANDYLNEIREQERFPLCLLYCTECYHSQLGHTIPSTVMFDHYLYISGTNQTIVKYFEWLCDKTIKETLTPDRKIVLELASNDGTQLDCYKNIGWETYGVDPAINVSIMASDKGHIIDVDYWGVSDCKWNITPSIILAQNVIAHVPDPEVFLRGCTNIMDDNTKLYVQTSQAEMYQRGEFDTIYHEHLSYFTSFSMDKLADMCDLKIISLEKTPIHGTSYLFTMMKKTSIVIPDNSLKTIQESEKCLRNDEYYIEYRKSVEATREWLLNKLSTMQVPIICYGAAAKGMTLLNYLGWNKIEYVIDDSLLKQEKYTPGTHKLICSSEFLQKDKRDLAIMVLAWNFWDEILQRIKHLRIGKNTILIKPFPQPSVWHLNTTGELLLNNS